MAHLFLVVLVLGVVIVPPMLCAPPCNVGAPNHGAAGSFSTW
ncbi:MAG TPA: hypothetical protein VM509_12520 [Planctomycetota bacterium]|nr:hypothetical protein [Planctomycetota bacterium]